MSAIIFRVHFWPFHQYSQNRVEGNFLGFTFDFFTGGPKTGWKVIFWGLLLTFSRVLPKQGRRYVWPQRSPSTPTEVSAWKAEEVFLSVSQFLCSTRNLWPLVFNTSSSSFSKGMPYHPHHHHNPHIIYLPNWHHHHLNISTKKILTQCKFAN